MPPWMTHSCAVIGLWGLVGLLQKLGTRFISSRSLIVWVTAGYIVLLPALLKACDLSALTFRDSILAITGGIVNGAGAWCLFCSLERGAKASVAVPLTALNPLLTILLAIALLGERPTAIQWSGILMSVAAGAMISHE